jgi:LPXTG-motif cell wall-anchored protein
MSLPRRALSMSVAVIAVGVTAIVMPSSASAAPVTVPLDLACAFVSFGPDDDEPALANGLSDDVPVTMDYTSPTSDDIVDVQVQFDAGIVNELDATLEDISVAAYAIEAVTEDGVTVGGGVSDDIAIDPPTSVGSGAEFGGFSSATVSVELSSYAAGRTVFLQPSIVFGTESLSDELLNEDLLANFALGSCAPGTDLEELVLVEDFPLEVDGTPIPLPVPGEQTLTVPSGSITPNTAIDADAAGFLPFATLAVYECPVEAGVECSTSDVPDPIDPELPDVDELFGLPLDALSTFAAAGDDRSALQTAAATVVRTALEDEDDVGFTVIFTDGDGIGAGRLVVGSDLDACGAAGIPCQLVAVDAFDTEYAATAALDFTAETETPTATPSPTQTPVQQEQPAARLPETGSHVIPLAWSGLALALAGAGVVLMTARRGTSAGPRC